MPISSVSRVFNAPDPVMETDLELLAKVNTFQQTKFDTGAAALQQEVDNWAAMTQIAKPELRQYANTKLVNLVNGISNLGGVNLSDVNNVNSLKSMGYNIYGDSRIMDGIETTMKMKALQADASKKLSGKDAGKYDNTLSNYLMKGYQEWASDGDVENTRYDGPVALPEGNMNMINEKVQKYLKELKPDAESMPQGDLAKSYGYFQVDGKWLKGDRIREAINAVTDENDSLIFKAHGWAALNNNSDRDLQDKIGLVYDTTSANIKRQINTLQTQLNNTSDAGTKMQIEQLIQQQKTALVVNEKEKKAFIGKPQLSSEEREGIQESLYRNAWQSNIENSYGYNQQKTEYKANMPLIFHDRMQLQAEQWAKDYDLRVANYELNKAKTEAEINKLNAEAGLAGGGFGGGGTGLPVTQQANTGTNNEQKSPEKLIDQLHAEYFGAAQQYNRYMLNLLGANDTKGRFENVNGEWIPKPEYKDQIDKETQDLNTKVENYAKLSDAERAEVDKLLPTDKNELQAMFMQRSKITALKAFDKMARDKETEAINLAIANGKMDFDWRNVGITIGSNYKQMTVEEALTLYNAGVLTDDTDLSGIAVNPNTGMAYFENNNFFPTSIDNLKDLKKGVEKMRAEAEKEYSKAGGNMFNSYSVPLPFDGLGKTQKEIIQKQLSGLVDTDNSDSVNPIEGKIEYDFKNNKPSYQVKVEYKKGTKQQAPKWVDVSQTVMDNMGTGAFGIQTAFPKQNITHAWGLSLSNNGSTPFDKKDEYKDAIRTTKDNYPFQVATIPNALNGTTGAKVKIALPVGGGKTVEVNVKNFQTGDYSFPPYVETIQAYLDLVLSTPEKKAQFYKQHNLEMPE